MKIADHRTEETEECSARLDTNMDPLTHPRPESPMTVIVRTPVRDITRLSNARELALARCLRAPGQLRVRIWRG